MRSMPRRNLWRSLGRGILLRCARCGGRGVMKSWFTMHRRCPHCGLVLDRGESSDYWLGAYTINFIVAEFVAVLLIVAMILFMLPDISWTVVQWASIVAAVAMPILFFPFSRTLWLALDLWARPSERGDRARRSHLN